MNHQEAKNILLLYRPGIDDPNEPELAAALQEAKSHPELQRWFEQSCAFHESMRAQFRQIAAPPDLRETILADQKTVRPNWWRKPVWLAAAAVFVAFLGIAVQWFTPGSVHEFGDFRNRMVRTVSRHYRMDKTTDSLKDLRQFMAQRGTPSDYTLSHGLDQLSLTGGGCLRWHNKPVSMVCFDRGDKQMLFLFVIDRSAVQDPPETTEIVAKVNHLLTVGWSQDNRTYLLTGPEDSDLLRKRNQVVP